jgi:hypothetical protein
VLAVSIGVPVLLCYVYAVVPIALCRSDGCGVSAGENGGVRIDVDEEEAYRPVVSEAGSLINARGIIANPSIGEVNNPGAAQLIDRQFILEIISEMFDCSGAICT